MATEAPSPEKQPEPPREAALQADTWSQMVAGWDGRADGAIATPTLTWSGDELIARTAGAAAMLGSLGRSGAEDEIAVPALLEASPGAFAFLLAGAAIGRPLAPLSPRSTAHEVRSLLTTLASPLLLTASGWLELAREATAGTTVRVEVIEEAGRGSSEDLDLDADPDSVAFVLHTSGTTGRPKPVPYRQGRLAKRARVVSSICRLGPGARYATMSPLHHVAGLGNHTVALASGACTVPVPRFAIERWRDVAALETTHILCVPTVLDMLLDEGALALESLRVLQYGAAPIHPETLREVLALRPDVDLANMFGQTEGSPITCLTPADHRRILHDSRDELLASAGRAVEGVEVYIDAPDRRGVGEVVARGQHLMRVGEDGWLHTGDLGRIDDEGYLFLVGRQNDMILRGGENVHPLEVEQALELHPSVRQAAVVGVPDRRLGQEVAAFVIPADRAAGVDPAVLRAHTRRLLAGFKTPSRWVVIDELPRNVNGKLLRSQLSASIE